MQPTDLTIEILKSIRDEVRTTNVRVDSLREELRGTNLRVDGLREELHGTNHRIDALREETARRFTESETRLSTELVAVAGAVREVRDLLRDDRQFRDQVTDHERRLSAIENRLKQ
jgi:chromosome segregation ATPase